MPDLSDEDLRTLISLAKRVLWDSPDVRRRIQEHGVNIVPANFYSDIPLISEIESSFEYSSESAPYLSPLFDDEAIASFVDRIGDFAAEFVPPHEGDLDNPGHYFRDNPAFPFIDAVVYYSMIRLLKPKRVLEVGSGFSTLVADEALKRNGSGSLVLVEPYPKPFLRDVETVDQIHERPVQGFALDEFVGLVEDSDIWFIDSTHTVKVGSDCLYIYLLAMPQIESPTYVHTHDVSLPFATPAHRALEKHIYWTEQYLLLAYLLDNPKVQIVYGSSYIEHFQPERFASLTRQGPPQGGGSLWYRLN